jgi:hypothetical protein
MHQAALRSALILLLSFAIFGQTRPGKVPVDWTQVPIQNTSDVLDIVLNQLDGVDWIVGVKVNAGADNSISVGDGTRGPMFQRIAGHSDSPPGIAGHARDRIRVSGSSVFISGGAEGQVLFVYVELSQARGITVRDDQGRSSFAQVSDGIVIDNGNVFKNSLQGPGELASLAMLGLNAMRASFGWGPVVAIGRTARPESLRLSHYVEFERVAPPSSSVTAYARFNVSPTGDVTSVSLRDVPELTPAAIASIKSTISQWKFQPIPGKAQPINDDVMVVVSPDGRVRSSIFSSSGPPSFVH